MKAKQPNLDSRQQTESEAEKRLKEMSPAELFGAIQRAVLHRRIFPDNVTAADACDRIKMGLLTLKEPKSERNRAYQRIHTAAVFAYLKEARAATSDAKKWRSIAEATFWWSAAFSLSSDQPYGQQKGADAIHALADARAAEARRVRDDGNPATGRPWATKEELVKHLQGKGLGPPGKNGKRVHSRGAIFAALSRKIGV